MNLRGIQSFNGIHESRQTTNEGLLWCALNEWLNLRDPRIRHRDEEVRTQLPHRLVDSRVYLLRISDVCSSVHIASMSTSSAPGDLNTPANTDTALRPYDSISLMTPSTLSLAGGISAMDISYPSRASLQAIARPMPYRPLPVTEIAHTKPGHPPARRL